MNRLLDVYTNTANNREKSTDPLPPSSACLLEKKKPCKEGDPQTGCVFPIANNTNQSELTKLSYLVIEREQNHEPCLWPGNWFRCSILSASPERERESRENQTRSLPFQPLAPRSFHFSFKLNLNANQVGSRPRSRSQSQLTYWRDGVKKSSCCPSSLLMGW